MMSHDKPNSVPRTHYTNLETNIVSAGGYTFIWDRYYYLPQAILPRYFYLRRDLAHKYGFSRFILSLQRDYSLQLLVGNPSLSALASLFAPRTYIRWALPTTLEGGLASLSVFGLSSPTPIFLLLMNQRFIETIKTWVWGRVSVQHNHYTLFEKIKKPAC